MKETVLLYNASSFDKMNKIKMSCIQMGIHIVNVKPEQYKVPIGFLAFGSTDQQEEYILKEDIPDAFDQPLMVIAAMTNGRLQAFLDLMRKNKAPYVGLKCVMTEHNATWDSLSLYEEIKKEHEAMTGKKG